MIWHKKQVYISVIMCISDAKVVKYEGYGNMNTKGLYLCITSISYNRSWPHYFHRLRLFEYRRYQAKYFTTVVIYN